MLGRIEEKAARAGRKAALGFGATLCLIAGAAFLTTAAWIALSIAADTLTAAFVIGMAYTGLGIVLFAFAKMGHQSSHDEAKAESSPQVETDAPPIIAAFVHGMNAGAQAARRH